MKQNWIKMSWWQKASNIEWNMVSEMALAHNTQYLSTLKPYEYKIDTQSRSGGGGGSSKNTERHRVEKSERPQCQKDGND